MDWKQENPKQRYIDSIKWEEAKRIAFLAAGEPDNFELLKLDAESNGNNIPHVKLHYRYYEPILGNGEVNFIGIFSNLNIYSGNYFGSVYCQKELFETFKEFGFD